MCAPNKHESERAREGERARERARERERETGTEREGEGRREGESERERDRESESERIYWCPSEGQKSVEEPCEWPRPLASKGLGADAVRAPNPPFDASRAIMENTVTVWAWAPCHADSLRPWALSWRWHRWRRHRHRRGGRRSGCVRAPRAPALLPVPFVANSHAAVSMHAAVAARALVHGGDGP